MEEKIYNLKDRSFAFAKKILEIADLLSRSHSCDIIRNQLIRSGTSIGANIEEADGSLTRKDFTNKMAIARKEAKETRYWLRLLIPKYLDQKVIEKDIKEVEELISILSAIINKTKS